MPNVYLTEKEIYALGDCVDQLSHLRENAGDEYIQSTNDTVEFGSSGYKKMLRSIGRSNNKKMVKEALREARKRFPGL